MCLFFTPKNVVSFIMQIKAHLKWCVSLQWCFQQIEFLIKLITLGLQAPQVRISQLKTTPGLFVGFVFLTCVIACSPAEHRFVRGEEPPVRPLTGLPDFPLLLKAFGADLCHLVVGSSAEGGRNTVDTHIRKTCKGSGWVIWRRASLSNSSGSINTSSRRLLSKLFN